MANPAQHNKLNNLDGEPEVQEQVTLGPEWNEQESDEDTRQTQHQSMTPRDTIDPTASNLPTPEDYIQNLAEIFTPQPPEGVAGNADSVPTQIGPASPSKGGQTPSEYRTVYAGACPGWNSTHSHNTRFKSRLQANMSHALSSLLMQDNEIKKSPTQDQLAAMLSNIKQQHTLEDGTCNYLYPWALQNDVLHYGEMLQADDRPDFVDAMKKEVDGLWHMLQVVPRSSMPEGVKPLPAVWAFKRKRLPDWTIQKYKARLNAHGGKQKHGVNYWETYAPVVNWTTVHLTLILSILHGFKSRQVDFVQAFTQAPLDCPSYLETSAGYQILDGKLQFAGKSHKNNDKSFVLKLLKNMYGPKQAGHNWYNKLTDELLSLGFIQSKVDKCLFIYLDCIILVYVDDSLIFSPSEATLDTIVSHLNKQFIITSGTDIETYLGLEINPNENATTTLKQPALIAKVIALCGLDNKSNEHMTPADSILQPPLPTDEPRIQNWLYRQHTQLHRCHCMSRHHFCSTSMCTL